MNVRHFTRMIMWFKKLTSIVANYDNDKNRLNSDMKALEKLMKDRTDIAVDIGLRESHVIVVGKYKNTDYVQTYIFRNQDFIQIVEYIKRMERYATVRQIDAHPQIRAIVKKHLNLI